MIIKTKEPIFSLNDNSVLKNCIFNIYLLENGYSYSAYIESKKKHLYSENIHVDSYSKVNNKLIEVININILKKNKILVKTDAISLIPKTIFNSKDLDIYASTLLNTVSKDIWYTKISSIDAVLIYTIPHSLLEIIKTYFPNLEIIPIDKIVLENISSHVKKKSAKILCNIEDNCASIAYINNKYLNYYNHIKHNNPQEFINALLAITKILKLEAYKIPIIISGQVDVHSEYIKEICNYFTKVKLAKIPDILNFDSSMKNIPQHYFYNLFIAPLCV